MDQTFTKEVVLAAANATAQQMRKERADLLAEWDAHSIVWKFGQLFNFTGGWRPESHGTGRQRIAERISFKATFCTETNVSLNDAEIDSIRDSWLKETK